MAIVTAKYRAFISDNYQGGSGKTYEDQVQFEIDEENSLLVAFGRADMEIKSKTKHVATLTMCSNDENFQLISIEITE